MEQHPYQGVWNNWRDKLVKDQQALLAQHQELTSNLSNSTLSNNSINYESLLDQWHESKGKLDNINSMLEQIETNQYLRY